MKIGTDSVLLGAWIPLEHNPISVLDIGAGTGILSLMLAQRSVAEQIDAIEIDEDAYEECVENFEQSKWNDRLFCYHSDLLEFTQEMYEDESYDLIISNPPFFSEDYHSDDNQRNMARFQDSLPFQHLLQCVQLLLSDKGVFSVIVPYKEEKTLINIAQQYGLHPFKITRVRGTQNTNIKRSLIAFSFVQKILKEDQLVIEIDRHLYTEEYIALTKDFYLKM